MSVGFNWIKYFFFAFLWFLFTPPKKSASTESSGALNGIIKKLFGTDRRQTTDRQMKLRYNTHGCELINLMRMFIGQFLKGTIKKIKTADIMRMRNF